jgi:pSer/pThr/pTyr-binding forkhead associated (FHA) protein
VDVVRLVKVTNQREIPIKPDMVLGRQAECDLQLTEGHASRRHAKFSFAEDAVWLEDLNSANGTFVNGTRITSKVKLSSGDRLRFDVEEFDVHIPKASDGKTQRREPASAAVAAADSGVYKRPGAWADPDAMGDGANKTKFIDPAQLKQMMNSQPPATAAQTASIDGPHLHVVSGSRAGLNIKLMVGDSGVKEWTIGSQADREVQFQDSGVSALHAKIVNEGERWKVFDQMSANGTYVNGKRSNVSHLIAGDRVRFGPVECIFQASRAARAGSPPRPPAAAPGPFSSPKLPWVIAVAALVLVATLLWCLWHFLDRTLLIRGATTAAVIFGVLAGIAIGAVLLTLAASYLRAKKNCLYWEVSCWLLVTMGILLRPIVVRADSGVRADAGGVFIAGLAALFVLPAVMRLLNRIKETPGLSHVATPLGMGFFLDVAQLMATTYVPGLSWLAG